METRDRKFAGSVFSPGSALILAVVLTSILAIVGVLFVMMARVDKVATSAISENRELDLAVETVIAGISQQLVSDVPGVAGQEYYDYPDPCDSWLASLEPKLFDNGTPANPLDDLYIWPHITDLYGNNFGMPPYPPNYYDPDDRNNPAQWDSGQPAISDWYLVSPYNVVARVVADQEKVDYTIRDMGDWNTYADLCPVGIRADADGDGIADSRWVIVPDMTSSKGEPIYAAVRVVDNQGMSNANAHFKFDPNAVDANQIDGSSQLQIDLMALSWRPGFTVYDPCEEIYLLEARANPALGLNPLDLQRYEQNVIWRYLQPNGPYTPFDISDELEMRYRYLLNHTGIDTRLEAWGGEFRINTFQTPVAQPGDLIDWFYSAYYGVGMFDPNYAYRHITTTYNMDRIIDPRGGRMININNGNVPVDIPYQRYTRLFPLYPLDMNTPVGILYDRLLSSLGPVIADPNIVTQYAQLAANMVDFSDDDDINNDGVLDFNCVTTLVDPYGIVHYGFEAQPFITEIAWKIDQPADFYAVELYNPSSKKIILRNNFVLELVSREDPSQVISIIFDDPCDIIDPNSYFVIANNLGAFTLYNTINPLNTTNLKQDPALVFFGGRLPPDKSKPVRDPRPDPDKSKPPVYAARVGSYDLYLKRLDVPTVGGIYIDKQPIEPNWALSVAPRIRDFGRDVRDWRVIYYLKLIEDTDPGGSLGMANYFHTFLEPFSIHDFSFFLPNPLYPRASFITVGDIPRILTLGHGITRNSTIGQQLLVTELLQGSTAVDQEHSVRLDLRNPFHRNVFQYLTVFDPTRDFIDNDGDGLGTDLDGDGFLDSTETDLDEVKIPGRININTAPWYVIAQLPWMTNEIAQAIVAYRDRLPIPVDYSIGRYDAIIANSPLNDDFAARFAPWTVREQPGFTSIGELNFIIAGLNNFNITQYAIDGFELPGFPDLTTRDDDPPIDMGDEVIDDFEERDVIFSRISNLVSVRSDVFTAYILVRIGADGPQKRVVAILDRSGVNKNNVRSPDGKVRIVALHYVPDPR